KNTATATNRTSPMKLKYLAGAVLLTCCAVMNTRADYASSVLSHSPLGYWRFDEAASSPALNSVANSSPQGHALDGYAVLDLAKGQRGKIGSCIRLNNAVGITHCSSKVDVPYNATLNPQPPFTVEFWANPNSMPVDANGFGLCPVSSVNPNGFGGSNRS